MSLRVEKLGLLTTVQDRGRYGYQQVGVVVSGAMDAFALEIANALVGNRDEAAVLEFCMLGPSLRFEADHIIGLMGAEFSPKINGKSVPLWRPVLVKKGALLEIGSALKGCWGYLAVAGGVAVPEVMGSFSTYLRAGIGGLNGSALQPDEVVPCFGQLLTELPPYYEELKKQAEGANFAVANWLPSHNLFPAYQKNPIVRAMRGPEYERFSGESQQVFWEKPFQVTNQSDRMGYRLEGPAMALAEERELLSTAVTFGTVQVPAQGNPIVLMADRQTTGGYPRIAQVISADLPVLAQARPGEEIRFKEVTLAEAQQLYLERELHLRQLKSSIAFKLQA